MKQVGVRAARYVAVGAANTLLYSIVLYLFLEILTWGSRVAVTLAYCIAVPFHFLMIRYHVFRSTDRRIQGQILRYAVLVAMSYGISLTVVYIGIDVLNLASWIVVIANVAATTIAGFLLASAWVFH